MPKISELPIQTNAGVNPGDTMPIVDSFTQETKQIPMAQMDIRWSGVPDGGTSQQVLAKNSGTNKDVYWKTLDKNSVGLGLVDNTSDLNKPISTATQNALNLKANTSALSTKADVTALNNGLATKQDKLPNGTDGYVLTLVAGIPQWTPGGGGGGAVLSVFGRVGNVIAQTGDYDKSMIGLDQVDNTSDLDKPISTATATALSGKQASLGSGVNGQILSLVAGTPTWINPPAVSPLTTKGDIYGHNGTTGVRIPVGTNGQLLTADSTVPAGVAFKDAPVSLPSQTGNAGKILETDGTNASWADKPKTVVSATQTIADGGVITRTGGRVERVKVQASAGTRATLTIAASPTPLDGDQLFIQGMSNTAPVVVGPFEDLVAGQIGHLMYDLATTTWVKVGGV